MDATVIPHAAPWTPPEPDTCKERNDLYGCGYYPQPQREGGGDHPYSYKGDSADRDTDCLHPKGNHEFSGAEPRFAEYDHTPRPRHRHEKRSSSSRESCESHSKRQ